MLPLFGPSDNATRLRREAFRDNPLMSICNHYVIQKFILDVLYLMLSILLGGLSPGGGGGTPKKIG